MVGSDKRLAPTLQHLHSNQMIGCGLAQFLFLTRRASSVLQISIGRLPRRRVTYYTTRSPKTKSKPDILSHGSQNRKHPQSSSSCSLALVVYCHDQNGPIIEITLRTNLLFHEHTKTWKVEESLSKYNELTNIQKSKSGPQRHSSSPGTILRTPRPYS